MNNFYLTTTRKLLVKNIITLLLILFTSTLFSQGNTCATATSLTINGACGSGTINDATENTPLATGCSLAGVKREGWYTFTVTGGPLNITITAQANNRNLFLQLISSSASCTTLTQIACANADTTNNSVQTETITASLANGIYYVKVISNATGNNDMVLNSICVTSAAPPVTNDDCTGAIPLTINTSCSYSTYTNIGATATTSPSTPPAPGCASYSGGDVWFSFLVPANGQVTVDTQTGGMTDSGMAWYTGTCGSLTLLECDDDDSANGLMSSITRSGLTPGTTVYVRIWEYSNDNQGTFGICATSPGPCTTPAAQASGFTSGTVTSTAFPASFSGTADSYLVIRSTSATPPSQPVNGVVYTAANIGTLGAGLTFVQNGTATTIAGTGLNGNTRYYYYIYAYNNTNCSGGPLYNASGALTGNAVTCPATPSPVTTSATLNSINFSWPSSIGGGINAVSYQLQVTTDAGYTINVLGSPFTINDPTITYNLTGLTANTTYYYRIRANNGCWSPYTTGTATTGYCAATNSTNTTYYISGITTTGGVANINNTPTGFTAGGYANYTAMVVSQNAGLDFNITATHPSSTYGYTVWVDWNNDLDFDDVGETVISTDYVATPAALGTVTIPGGTAPGNYRMRIRNAFLSNPAPSCGDFAYGEAEDYTITVLVPAPCSGTPTGGTVTTSPNTGWPGSTYTVSASGYTYASNMTYQWQYSTDGGTTWTNATAATASYANYNATAPASGDVHWQLIVTCTNSSQSATSTTGIFVTMTVSDVETGCPNVVSGGLGLNGADPAPFDCTATATCVDLEATYLDLGNTTSYIVEPIAYNPPFAFNGLLNPVSVNTDDVWSPIVPLPFKFCFYGNTYEQCLIGSNGVITFDLVNNSPGGFCDWSMYDTTAANLPVSGHEALIENSIFGVFHDINPTSAGNVGWELITLATGCRALVVSWSNVPMYSNDTANDYTGMMVLYENSNIIEVYVQKKRITTHPGFGTEPMWNDGNAVIGIQNANGTLASVPPGRNALDPNWSATNEAWRFVPNGTSIASIAWYEGATASGPVLGTNDILNVCPTATTTYTAEITYTLCDGRTIKETDTTTVTVNGAKVWNGSVSTDWNTNNNWTPVGRPTALDCVVIPDVTNQPIISGTGYNGLGLNMSIQNGADLTVNSNNAVTITDWVTMNTSGNLILQNSASLIQVNNVANTGTMNMDRTAVTSSTLDYVYWSSPVNSFNVSNITPASTFKYEWTPTVNNGGAYLGNFGNWFNASGAMTIGKGYIVRGSSGNSTFTGIPNNGNITTPISRGTYAGSNYTGPTSTMVTQDDDNWNLIGNPYPSALDAIDFLTLNTNIDGFVKIWTHGTLPVSAVDPFYQDFVYNYTLSDYITYNSSGASSGPGVFGGSIAAAQGFFVSMLHSSAATSETVQFNNSMRSHLYNNSAFYRSTEGNTLDKNRIWLDLIAPNQSNVRTLVGYIDTATNGRDRLFDAITDNKTDLNLYSQIGNELFTIQGKATPFNDNDFINLGVKVPASGIYSISIAAVDGLFENTNQDIYIEDIENNIIHDLRAAPYSFNITEGDNTNRFVLRFKNNRLSNEEIEEIENNIWVVSNDILTVQSTQNSIKSITIHDVIGRLISKKDNVNANEFSFSTLQKNNTTLLLKIELNNGIIVNKKVLF